MNQFFNDARQTIRAVSRAAVFLLKVFPMLPSQPVDWLTKSPVIKKVRYPTCSGQAEGDLYLPSSGGPYPGILVCLGVVPFGVDHPQVPVLGNALARAGFAALLYWSPAMRDFRLDLDDIENVSLAYHWLTEQSYIDRARSGLLGTCVGGSFVLMAAATRLIRDRISFVSAYAPYSSLWTFIRDVASATRSCRDGSEPWQVDPLTRKVFVSSMISILNPDEAVWFQGTSLNAYGNPAARALSADGRAVYSLLTAQNVEEAETTLHHLPPVIRERLDALSPMNYLKEIHAPLIILLHDSGDQVIPVGESRRLHSALAGHAGVYYTEMDFQHLDPVKAKLSLFHLIREFKRFFLAMYPLFRHTQASS